MPTIFQSSIANYSNFLTNYSQSLECSTIMSQSITDGIATITSNRITGLFDPVSDMQIANKHYSDIHPIGSSVSGQNNWIQYNTSGNFDSTSSLTFDGSTISSNGYLIGNTYSAIIQNLTYYSNTIDSSITISYIGSGIAGSETVTVTNSDIVVNIEDGISTTGNIKNAIANNYYSSKLVSSVISSGNASSPQFLQSLTSLTLESTAVGAVPGIFIKSGRITNISSVNSGYNKNYTLKSLVDELHILNQNTISSTSPHIYNKSELYNGYITRIIPGTDPNLVITDVVPNALRIISNTISGTNSVIYASLASTINIDTLSGTSTMIDGIVANSIGSKVLLKCQNNSIDNGLWTINTGAWTRPIDFSSGSSVYGYNIYVQQGQLAEGTEWSCSGEGSGIVDTDKLIFERTIITTNRSFNFSINNASSSAILKINSNTGVTFEPSTLINNYIYPGYVMSGTFIVNSVLAGSEAVTFIAETLSPSFLTPNFFYGPRSINNTVANTVIKDKYIWNTKSTTYFDQNMVYKATDILGIIVRNCNGLKLDSFSSPASFISGFSNNNSPITYIFGTGAVKLIIKNASVSGNIVISPSTGWTLDPNSNMTISPGKVGTFWLRIDVENVLGYIYVISIS